MKKNSFKKLLAFLTMLTMVLTLVAVPNVSANADDAKGEINFANGYDWTAQSSNIYAFASTSAEASVSTLTSQPVGTFQWFTYIVLERNEDYNYVVTDKIAGFEGNTADGLTLGAGKIILMMHGDAGTAHPESYNFFMALEKNDVLAASTYWEAIAGAAGAQTGLSFAKAAAGSVGPKAPTKGAINYANGSGRVVEVSGVAAALDICAIVNADATKTVSAVVDTGINWWSSMILEKDATKGTWVVKAVDLNPTDGVCAIANETLGEGKMVIAIHGGVEDKESAAFFMGTATVGQEYYLVGEVPAGEFAGEGTALTGVYLTTEKPEAEKPAPEPAPENPPTGDFDTTGTVTLLMVGVAFMGVALVLKKRNNLA